MLVIEGSKNKRARLHGHKFYGKKKPQVAGNHGFHRELIAFAFELFVPAGGIRIRI
jgi:hypothetical protein